MNKELVCFCWAVIFSSVASWSVRPHTEKVHDSMKPWNEDLAEIYRQELNHDLQWNDDVDGSYDLPSSSNGKAGYKTQHSKSRVLTNFRIIPNAVAWSASTPTSVRSRFQTANNHATGYPDKHHSAKFTGKQKLGTSFFEKLATPESDEIELVLGQGDVTPSGFNVERQHSVTEAIATDDDDSTDTSDNDDNETDSSTIEETEEEGNDDEEVTTFEPMTDVPKRYVSSTRPTPVAVTVSKVVQHPLRLKISPEIHVTGPVFNSANRKGDVDKRVPQVLELTIEKESPHRSLTLPIVLGCLGSVIFASIIAVLLHRRSRKRKASFDEECLGYGLYGVTGPVTKPLVFDMTASDRVLSKAVETYHYQSQKRELSASSNSSGAGSAIIEPRNVDNSDYDTENDEEEGDEYGDYTVYECPGLAPPGDFEVINPLFADQSDSVEIVTNED